MNRKLSKIVVRAAVAVLCSVVSAWTDVPPPPVNQIIGVPDSIFENLTTAECRACHGESVGDRHHTLAVEEDLQCTDCHQLQWDDSCQCYIFAEFRECFICHVYDPQGWPSTPHHQSESAALRHCSDCHGSVVEDYDDDHYVPDYDISGVTPDPVCKTWDGPICTSGGCLACHTDDPSAVPPIAGFGSLHHAAQFNCSICHQVHGNIRACEDCHGPGSLHNIQADSDNPANPGVIIPGEENLGWGHIGNGWDCFGCHESFENAGAAAQSAVVMAASATPQTGATVPSIGQVDTDSIVAGQETVITLDGSGFVNEHDQGTLYADIVLMDGESSFVLASLSVDHDRVVAVVPSTMAVGLYELRAVKGDKRSNKKNLAVIPPVRIDSATCSDGTVTINGSGFSGYMEAVDSGIGVTSVIKGTSETGSVISWNDEEILAQFSTCGETVEVGSIFGTAAAEIPVPTWGTASVIGKESRLISDIGNCLFLLLIPIGSVLLWKILGRRK